MTQKENWSARGSEAAPHSCSGARYSGVPTTGTGGEVTSGLPAVGAAGAARPKSLTRTRPSTPISTFSGLKSRCTSPARWAAASPWPAWNSTSRISSQPRGALRIQRRRSCPSTSSIAKYTCEPTSPASCTWTTWGWASLAMARASRSNLPCCSSWAGPGGSGRSSLSATFRSSWGS